MGLLRSLSQNGSLGNGRWRCCVFALLLLSWPATAQDFAKGRSAYNLGNYGQAFAIWQKLALRGDPKAQSSIGYLYLRGLGVPVDHELAITWYREAALKGQPEALYFLGTLYLNGQGVAHDNVRAYVACELALSKGIAAALSCRDGAATEMSDAQMREAEKAVIRWYAKDEETFAGNDAPSAAAISDPP